MKRTTQVMKRATQRLGSRPHALSAAEAVHVKGGATATEYGLLASAAVEHKMRAPGTAPLNWYDVSE